MPSAIPCSLSPLISHNHSSLFSDWRHTVISKFFDTQVPSIFTKELVALAMCSLVFAATNTAFCSLKLAQSRIRLAAPADTSPKTLLISFWTVQLRTFCAALSLYDLWSKPWGVARLLGLHGLWKGSCSNNNNT